MHYLLFIGTMFYYNILYYIIKMQSIQQRFLTDYHYRKKAKKKKKNRQKHDKEEQRKSPFPFFAQKFAKRRLDRASQPFLCRVFQLLLPPRPKKNQTGCIKSKRAQKSNVSTAPSTGSLSGSRPTQKVGRSAPRRCEPLSVLFGGGGHI